MGLNILSRSKMGNHRRSLLARILPALGLFLLSPLCAEYLIGYLEVTGNFVSMLAGLLILAPLYGGAALIIREATRRTKRGWLTMIFLAFAFGIFQAGVIDHSLFSQSYQDTETPTYISLLGISGYNALVFVIGHVIWSICAPIAIVETFVSDRRKAPWLNNICLIITTVIYLLASLLIFKDQVKEDGFLPSVPQFTFTSIVIIILVFAAFIVQRHPRSHIGIKVPNPWLVGTIAFALLSLPTLLEVLLTRTKYFPELIMEWPGVVLYLLLLTLLGYLINRWSKREGWNLTHHLALSGGALLTRAWEAFLVEPLGVPIGIKLINNTIFLLGVMCLLFMCAYTISKKESQGRNITKC